MRTTHTNMDGLYGRMDSTKTYMQKSKEQPKTERCGNKYPVATFNMEIHQENVDDVNISECINLQTVSFHEQSQV